jgi:hypothetical protein
MVWLLVGRNPENLRNACADIDKIRVNLLCVENAQAERAADDEVKDLARR